MTMRERDIRDEKARLLRRYPADQERYWIAHLADGRQLPEHNCRWVDVPIHEVVMLELTMCGNRYKLERGKLPPTFVGFIQFKTAQRGLTQGTQVDETTSRCIGWTDGEKEYIIRIDEKTCKPTGALEVHETPPGQLPRHLHPQLRELLEQRR